VERPLQRRIDAYQPEMLTRQALSPRREQIAQRLKGFEQERATVEQQRDAARKWDRIADNIVQFRALLGSNVDQLRACKKIVSRFGVAAHEAGVFPRRGCIV
jgi:hypothetical protein